MQTGIATLETFLNAHSVAIFVIATLWTLPWKGVALWKAARLSHKWWFIVILIINTIGILEIIYIFFVTRRYTVVEEVEENNPPSRN